MRTPGPPPATRLGQANPGRGNAARDPNIEQKTRLQNWWQATRTVEPVPYSEFEQALAAGRLSEVVIGEKTITGKLKSPDPRGKTVIVATRVEPDLAARLSQYDAPLHTRDREHLPA